IRDALAPHKERLADGLWAVVQSPEKGKESQWLRAAAALTKYDPNNEKWVTCSHLVVNDLLLENPAYLGLWIEAFRPVSHWLLPPLSDICRERTPEKPAERNLATNLLADYAADQPDMLANLLMDGDDKQFAVLFPRLRDQAELGLPLLLAELDR